MIAVIIFTGTVLGAVAADRFGKKRDVTVTIGCLLGGVSCVAIPWAINLPMLGVLFAITGMCHALMQVRRYQWRNVTYHT